MDDDRFPTYRDYIIKLVTLLHEIQRTARSNSIQGKLRSKGYYDREANPKNCVVGDYVFLQKGPKPKKSGDHWTGPHKILEVFPNKNVHIEVGKSTKVVHSNRIRHSRIVPTYISTITFI